MRKIKTIFERNWDGNKKVINSYISDDGLFDVSLLRMAIPTEKLDGTNVRITVRNYTVVRAEKRRNPDKIQKHKGITEPWYVDASPYDPQDKYIYDGINNTNFGNISDGEWSGELLGPDIQGNPLNLESNRIVFFSRNQAPILDNVPTDYEGLKNYLKTVKSKYGKDCGIEGIVWHCQNGDMYKIKTKDF